MRIKKIFLITNQEKKESEDFKNLIQFLESFYKIKDIQIDFYDEIITLYDDRTITLLYLSDLQIKSFIKNHLTSNMNLGILPTQDNPRAKEAYGLSNDIYEVLADCFEYQYFSKIDILLCNNEPVFTNVIIGDVHGLNKPDFLQLTFFDKIKNFFAHLKNLHFKEYTLTTAKGQNIKTIATGIMVFEHNVEHSIHSIFKENHSLHDGQLNALILAPNSILSYIYYLFILFFYNKFSFQNLPKSMGIINSSKLSINTTSSLNYSVDGIPLCSKDIDLVIVEDGLNISLGKSNDMVKNQVKSNEQKESIKIKALPKGEIIELLKQQKVPFFKRAEEEDFKELFLSLKESAKLSSIFIVLMILSTTLATTGLFQSSTPVLIGAMILAPLMAPIVSLSMGIVRSEKDLLITSIKTLLFGIFIALLSSALYSSLIPLTYATEEIRGRLNPNILDLMVAIISGIAGAYANAKSEVAKSLAGVAIAVALVPPLSVTGIALGWGDLNMIYGSFLLFLTNLIGITLAAAITFIILGYAPVHRAKKGIIYSSIILGLVTIPLYISFMKLIDQNQIISSIQTSYHIDDKKIDINIVDIDLSDDIPLLKLETISTDTITKVDLYNLQNIIEKELQRRVNLQITTKLLIKSKSSLQMTK